LRIRLAAIAPKPAAAHNAQVANFLRDDIDLSLVFDQEGRLASGPPRRQQPREEPAFGVSLDRVSERSVHAAQNPADAKCDQRGRVGLGLDCGSDRLLKRAHGPARRLVRSACYVCCAFACLAVNVLGGLRKRAGHVSGLLFGVAERALEVSVVREELCDIGWVPGGVLVRLGAQSSQIESIVRLTLVWSDVTLFFGQA
jgi:hypothetical protein